MQLPDSREASTMRMKDIEFKDTCRACGNNVNDKEVDYEAVLGLC